MKRLLFKNNFTTGLFALAFLSLFAFGVTRINVAQIEASGTPSSGTFLRGDGSWNTPTATLADGDYGDITVSTSGTALTIDAGVVSLSKMADMTTASIIGRNTSGTGAPEVLSVSTVKTMFSISNIDNTSDANKPVSTATQAALDLKLTTSKYHAKEVPSGSINGSNTSFTLANTPVSGTEMVFLNGVLQESGSGNDYTISGGTITYLSAPTTGSKISVTYFAQ